MKHETKHKIITPQLMEAIGLAQLCNDINDPLYALKDITIHALAHGANNKSYAQVAHNVAVISSLKSNMVEWLAWNRVYYWLTEANPKPLYALIHEDAGGIYLIYTADSEEELEEWHKLDAENGDIAIENAEIFYL